MAWVLLACGSMAGWALLQASARGWARGEDKGPPPPPTLVRVAAQTLEGEGGGEGVNERLGPRYIVPTKRPRRPSESPLYASSSASASDDEGRGGAGEGKPANVGVHYPVKAKVKAKGIVRVRGRRSSDRAMEVDEGSESDGHEATGDSDKENTAVVSALFIF